jgi:hypothetical protein
VNSYSPRPAREAIRLPPGSLPQRVVRPLPERRVVFEPATLDRVRAHMIAEANAPTGKLEKTVKSVRRERWRDQILIIIALLVLSLLTRLSHW